MRGGFFFKKNTKLCMSTGSLPNSQRNPEQELMRILLTHMETDFLVNWFMHSTESIKGKQKQNDDQSALGEALQVLVPKRNVGSLAASDGFETYDLWQFLRLSRHITEAGTVGTEWFPGELMGPCRPGVTLPDSHYEFLLRYYTMAYENERFVDNLDVSPPGSIEILPTITQYARLRISGEFFGSMLSAKHSASAYILAKWEANDEVDAYPGQVQYFFTHTFYGSDGEQSTHYLAFVRWYRSIPSQRFYFSLGGNSQIHSDIELWKNEFLPESRDSILPLHMILGRFVPGSYRSFLTVSPLNRRYHL
jgi:hypothetical protein